MKNGIELVRTSSTVGEINLHLQLTPAYRRDIFFDEQVKELTKIYFLEKAKKLGIIISALDFGPDHFHAFISSWKHYSVEKLDDTECIISFLETTLCNISVLVFFDSNKKEKLDKSK